MKLEIHWRFTGITKKQPRSHYKCYLNQQSTTYCTLTSGNKAQTLHIFRIKNQRKKVWGKERGKKEALTTHSVTTHGKFISSWQWGPILLGLGTPSLAPDMYGKTVRCRTYSALKQIPTTKIRHQLPIYSLSQDLAIQQHIIKILDSIYLRQAASPVKI